VTRRGQGLQARLARLEDGCCPVHGLALCQSSGYDYDRDGAQLPDDVCPACHRGVSGREVEAYTLEECPRRDCSVVAAASGPGSGEVHRLLRPDWLVREMGH